MVNINELYPGCKVRIADRWVSGCHQARSGEMDRWLGSVMTVQEISPRGFVTMEEDAGYGPTFQDGHWRWFPAAIAEVLVDVPPIDDLI